MAGGGESCRVASTGSLVGGLGALSSMADLWTSNPNASRDKVAAMMRLTQHAEIQVLRRGIDLAWVAAAVATPDWTAPDPDPALMRSYKAITEFGARVLRVVHRPDGKDVLVVTAHFDRSARP